MTEGRSASRRSGAAWLFAGALTLGALGAAPPPGQEPARQDPAKQDPAKSATTAESEPARKAREVEEKRLEALKKEYERIAGEPTLEERPQITHPATDTHDAMSLGVAFVKMLFVLGGVSLLAYLLLGKLLPRLMKIEAPVAQRHLLQVIDRLPLDQRRAILILKVGDDFYLVGASDQNISLMSRLDADQVKELLASQDASRREPGRFASVFMRRES